MNISERMVLESNAGFYIGRTQDGCPYDRQSIYYYSKWEANLLIGNVDQKEATLEIEQELPRAKKLKSSLGKKRVAFLLHALEKFNNSGVPIERWDYNA
jgi:hypothetical protein